MLLNFYEFILLMTPNHNLRYWNILNILFFIIFSFFLSNLQYKHTYVEIQDKHLYSNMKNKHLHRISWLWEQRLFLYFPTKKLCYERNKENLTTTTNFNAFSYQIWKKNSLSVPISTTCVTFPFSHLQQIHQT